MKQLTGLVCAMAYAAVLQAQVSIKDLNGAWQRTEDGSSYIMIIADGFFMVGSFKGEQQAFEHATGGIISMQGNDLQVEIEFDSKNNKEVGSFHLMGMSLAGNTMTLTHHGDVMPWQRIDDGKPGALRGAWLFSGRKRSAADTIQPYTPGVRKTMKIMSGTRFQWAAYNTETKEFLGTGGGTYTTAGGKYTENIGFFSRDNSRVGASLSFDMQLTEPHWHHSGLSSKGDPIFERWSRRSIFE